MKQTRKVILTNWVHYPVLYIVSYSGAIFFKIFDADVPETWYETLVSNLYRILEMYVTRAYFISIGIFVFFILSDILFFNILKFTVKRVLVLQCVILTLPLIIRIPHGGLWYVIVISLFISQWLRKKMIEDIPDTKNLNGETARG